MSKAKLDPRVIVGSICVGDHKPLLHTKYINCGYHGFIFIRRFLKLFYIISLWKLLIIGAGPVRTPGA